ncbi:MAG: ArnT family glycosyltransferase [Thermoanaerobaculaceae bacterium]
MEKRQYLAAILLLILSFGLTVPFRGLFEPDEPRYALVAQGMLQDGHWLVPMLEGKPYTHKPPLYLWLVAIFRALGLSWTAAAVLPAFAAAIGLLLLLPHLGRGFGLTPQQGYLAAMTLVASPLFATMSLAARMDMLLVLTLTTSLAAAFSLLSQPEAAGRAKGTYWLFWLALALAVLTKGPVAIALVGGTLVLFRLSSPTPLPWRRIFAGWGWLAGLALVFSWYLPAAFAQGKDWVMDTLVRQSAGRMVSSFAHREPFYFHLVTWPFSGFPSSCLGLVAAVLFFRKTHGKEVRFLSASFLSVLGFFSLVSDKLVLYLLPLVPISVLLSVKVLEEGETRQRWALGFSSVVGLGLGGAVVTLAWWRHELPLWLSALCGAGLLVGSVFALLALLRNQNRRCFFWLVVTGLWFTAVIIPVLMGALQARLTVAPVAARYATLASESQTGYVFREFFFGLPLYSGKNFIRLQAPEEVVGLLQRGLPLVISEKDAAKLPELFSRDDLMVERFPYRRSALLIVYLPRGHAVH